MASWISTADAVKLTQERFPQLGITQKILENWTKEGQELPRLKKGHLNGFDADLLPAWLERVKESIVDLSAEDYLRCFQFAISAYYGGITRSDFNRAKQRDVGEYLTNQIRGKLGEIALEKLLAKHNLKIDLDFSVTGQLPSQDITRISTRKNVWNNAAVKVSIKATKLQNILLTIPESEATLADRKSDIYVLSQVGLAPDHLLRLLKQHGDSAVKDMGAVIPDFGTMPARVAGWARHATVTSKPPIKGDAAEAEFGIPFPTPNHVLRTGELSVDWTQLRNTIVGTPAQPA